MIKFAYTILYVKDVTASAVFYEKAFGFTRKFITPDNTYGELETGNTTLSFALLELAKTNLKQDVIESSPANKPFAQEIAFSTENVEGTYENAIKAGAMPVSPAEHKSHGQTVAYVRDIDGFLIEICTPMG